jgi:ParB-like chromosome segregation protein Spo0J
MPRNNKTVASAPAPKEVILEIVTIPIDSVTSNTYNPNRQSDHEFELLCRSIEEDGFTQPILVRKDTMVIVDGEHRWRACKVIGMKTIPAIIVDFSDPQAMIATLRFNRARGSEDISKVADVIRDLHLIGSLDDAADSLMMDEVEMQILLDDIPQAELNLRQEGDLLTPQEVEEQILKSLPPRERGLKLLDCDNYAVGDTQVPTLRMTFDEFKNLFTFKKKEFALILQSVDRGYSGLGFCYGIYHR